MNKGRFLNRLQEMTRLDSREQVEDGAHIVLSLLSHRLTQDEKRDVAGQLSRDMQGLWNSDTWVTNYLSLSGQYQLKYRKKEELLSLVDNELEKRHLGIGAEKLVVCVFHVLKEQISAGEIEDIGAQLPKDIEELWLVA